MRNPTTEISEVPCGSDLLESDIEWLAEEVTRRKLSEIALFFLEAHRPLRGVFHQLTILSLPLFTPFFGAGKADTVLRIMESDEGMERLLKRIEENQKKENG